MTEKHAEKRNRLAIETSIHKKIVNLTFLDLSSNNTRNETVAMFK